MFIAELILHFWGLGKNSQFQNLVGPAQLLDLAFQRLDAFTLFGAGAVMGAAVDPVLSHSFVQRLRHTADLRGYRFNGSPEGGIFTAMLLHHAHGALADFGGELR